MISSRSPPRWPCGMPRPCEDEVCSPSARCGLACAECPVCATSEAEPAAAAPPTGAAPPERSGDGTRSWWQRASSSEAASHAEWPQCGRQPTAPPSTPLLGTPYQQRGGVGRRRRRRLPWLLGAALAGAWEGNVLCCAVLCCALWAWVTVTRSIGIRACALAGGPPRWRELHRDGGIGRWCGVGACVELSSLRGTRTTQPSETARIAPGR
jgi:hypothetical protein